MKRCNSFTKFENCFLHCTCKAGHEGAHRANVPEAYDESPFGDGILEWTEGTTKLPRTSQIDYLVCSDK